MAAIARTTCVTDRAGRALGLAPRRREEPGALVERAAAGDERAWQLLINRFDATIRALARRHGLNTYDCDEVAQRTWLALHRHVGTLGTHPAIGGWLLLTARRECLRVLAAGKRELPAEDPVAGREPTGEPIDETLLENERRDALHRAIRRAPDHERRVLDLLLRHPELTYDELSIALGIPKGSIGPTRGRCIARLRGDRHLHSVIHGRPQPGHDLA